MDTKLSDSGFPMKIGDQEYTASMLTDRDYGDLSRYIQSEYINIATRAAELIDDEDQRRELKSVALSEATRIGWMTQEGVNIISSLDGLIHLGFQMIRKRHPKILYRQFESEARKDIRSSLEEINKVDKLLNYLEKKEDTPSDNGANKS